MNVGYPLQRDRGIREGSPQPHHERQSDTGYEIIKFSFTRKQARRGRGAVEALSRREAAADYL